MLYLIDYIAHGPKFPHKFRNSPKSSKDLSGFIVTPALYPKQEGNCPSARSSKHAFQKLQKGCRKRYAVYWKGSNKVNVNSTDMRSQR